MLPAENWDNLVKTGKGKSYGVELSLAYKDRYNVIEAGYTLSWSLQKFTDFYPGWYSSKFDNRHKLNIAYRHKFNDRIDAYAAWVYRSGDRATVPNQYVNGPSFPGIPDSGEPELVYEKPNNITLPHIIGSIWVSISGVLPKGDSSVSGTSAFITPIAV